MFHLGLLRSADAYQALHVRMPLLSALVIHRLMPGYRASLMIAHLRCAIF
jgi:hypothetical protein